MVNKIIHIGMPKTGTTYLQRKYFPGLKDPSFIKCHTDYVNERIIKNILVSEEGLSGLPWNNKWKEGICNEHRFKNSFENSIKNLKIVYPEARILIVFRKHGDWLISLYAQYILEGGTLSFNYFYNENGVIRKEDLYFDKKLEFLKSNFHEVDVLSFEKFKLEGFDYFDRYFESLGYKGSTIRSKQKTHSRIKGKKLEFLRRINLVYHKFPSTVRNILRKNKIEPRNIINGRLDFWKTTDDSAMERVKKDVNEYFIEDWRKLEVKFFD